MAAEEIFSEIRLAKTQGNHISFKGWSKIQNSLIS